MEWRGTLTRGFFPDWAEVRMCHCFLRGQAFLKHCQSLPAKTGFIICQSYLMVISQQLVKEIDRIITDESLVLCIHKTMPILLGKSPKYVIILSIKLDVVFVKILKQVVSTKHFGDFDELVGVAVAVEKRFFSEYHRGEHCT